MEHVKFVEDCEEVFRISVDAMQPGRFLVDLIPACEVLAYADERTLTVYPVKHIPSWIPGSPRGYGEPLKKRLMTVFGAPFDYVQSKMVRFTLGLKGVRRTLGLGFWTELSIDYGGRTPQAPRGESEHIGPGRRRRQMDGWPASLRLAADSLSAHLSLIWMDSWSRNRTPSTYVAPSSRLTLLSDTCLSLDLSPRDGAKHERPAEGSSRDRSRRTGLAAAQRRRL
jgi:hypothetical protein